MCDAEVGKLEFFGNIKPMMDGYRYMPHCVNDVVQETNNRLTSCRRQAATICPHPGLQVVTRYTSYTHHTNIIHAHGSVTNSMSMLACQYSQPKRPGDLDLWPFDLESGVRVTCDVGYLCTNFSLPRPLRSQQGPMYATDRRQTASSLNAPGRGHNNRLQQTNERFPKNQVSQI